MVPSGCVHDKASAKGVSEKCNGATKRGDKVNGYKPKRDAGGKEWQCERKRRLEGARQRQKK